MIGGYGGGFDKGVFTEKKKNQTSTTNGGNGWWWSLHWVAWVVGCFADGGLRCVCVTVLPGRDREGSSAAGVFSPLSPLLVVYIDRRTN